MDIFEIIMLVCITIVVILGLGLTVIQKKRKDSPDFDASEKRNGISGAVIFIVALVLGMYVIQKHSIQYAEAYAVVFGALYFFATYSFGKKE